MYYVRQNLGSNKMVLNLVLALSDLVPKDTSNFTPCFVIYHSKMLSRI